MENAVRILMLEDRPEDAVLVKEELRRGGLRFTFERVEARDDFLTQLAQYRPDLILSDHGLPSFDGFSALRIAAHDGSFTRLNLDDAGQQIRSQQHH